jgi:glucose-1-phosphate thymidylyltransferase
VIGIVLAGGSGTRLYPLTESTSKQLLPVYDKPMIYYPIATLMLAGIREIILITTPRDQPNFKKLLGDGSQFGVNFKFVIQEEPKGLAQAFTLTENIISGEKTALILGDNIFHGTSLGTELSKFQSIVGAQIFGYHVANPQEYGVVTLDSKSMPIDVQEKPVQSKSSLAIPGLYFYDETVFEKASQVRMSARGEYEITSINQMYLNEQKLKVKVLPRGTAWLDTGSFETLFEASSFIRVLQERQGYKIGCLEEIALRNTWISPKSLEQTLKRYSKNTYTDYLASILEEFESSIK